MMLLIGYRSEKTFSCLLEYVASKTNDFEVLDFTCLRTVDSICIRQSSDELFLQIGNQKYWFSHYSSFYTRGYVTDFGHSRYNSVVSKLVSAISAYLQTCDQIVVNRPSASASNYNKFIHMYKLKDYGFLTPETIIIGEPQIAENIIDANGNWVSKSCSGVRTKVISVDDNHLTQLEKLKACPSLFQNRIYGADVRVHVVGNKLFPEKIISKRIDYRYSNSELPPNEYCECVIPEDIVTSCLNYCKDEDQLFAGFDFKIDENGKWYILEVNPMPGYESYDRRQGRRISKALYELLIGNIRDPFISEDRRTKLSPFKEIVT